MSGLVLAAGLSHRMGDFKPLMRIRDQSLLSLSVGSLLAGGAERVTVVLGHRAEEARAELEQVFAPSQICVTYNPAFAKSDMLASVKIGVSTLPICDAFYLLPGDMPAVARDTFYKLRKTMESGSPAVAFPTVNGYRKHPPLIGASCRERILAYSGDGGLRGLWRTLEGSITDVAVRDEGCLLDADTPQDFEQLARYLLFSRDLAKKQQLQHASI